MARRPAGLEPWMSYTEMAAYLGVSPRWLRYRVAEGLPCAIIGTHRRFKPEPVEKWLVGEGHMTKRGC